MGQYIVGTSDRYTQLICNTSSELIGDYPSITFRIHYNFQVRLTNYGSWYYNAFRLNFHTNQHTVNLACSFGGGGGTTGVLASGYIDLPIYGQSTTHTPGFSCSGPFSGNGVATENQTIPNGTLSSNLVSYDHDSCVVNVVINNPRNYFYVKVIEGLQGHVVIGDAANGNNTIGGLVPGTNQLITLYLYNRAGGLITSQQITFRTNGFSYLDSNVTNTIDDPIAFAVKTYDDTFTTRVKVTCGSIVLREVDVKSSGKIYNFAYAPINAQLSSIYALIPNSLSTTGTITLTTYVNGVAIGSTSYTITYKINETTNTPVITSFDYIDTSQKAIDKTGNNKWVLQNVSTLQIKDIVASAKNSSTIKSYRVSIGDTVVNDTTYPINVSTPIVSNSGIYLTVIDSRGLQATKLIAFTQFISYQKPVITKFEAKRVNDVEESTSIICEGTFDRLKIDNVDKNTAIKMKYRFKASDVSSWSTYQEKVLTITDSKFSYNNIVGQFDTGKSYDFELLIEDYFFGAGAYDLLVKSQFEFFIGDGLVEVNGEFLHNGNEVLSTINGITKDSNVVANLALKNGYAGFDNITGDYFRTPPNGLLPNVPGGSGCIGSDAWPFNYGYLKKQLYVGGVEVNFVHSTDEKWTGETYTDGWWIYVRTVKTTVANIKNIINSIGIKKIVHFYGDAKSIYNNTWFIPTWNPTASVNYKIEAWVNNGSTGDLFEIVFGSFYNSSSEVNLTIFYTKR